MLRFLAAIVPPAEVDRALRLRAAGVHQLAVVLDGTPRLVTWVVDGTLCDGGPTQREGFTWWPLALGKLGGVLPGPGTVAVASSYTGRVASVRWYTRYLRVSELVASFRAGAPA